MPDFREIATKYINKGFWVIPVNSMKSPSISNWYDLQTRPMTEKEIDKNFKKCHGIALLMGGSPCLVAIDFDLKYSLNPNLYEEVKEKLPVEILRKTYVQSTKNGGFHWIYKVPKGRLFGNEKFANRHTNAFEKHQIYLEYYSNPKTREIAAKTAANHKSLVLIESRSGSYERCGGYVLMPPTEGYEFVYGKLTENELTEEEYDILVETLRSFNEVSGSIKTHRTYDNFQWKLSPWEDYNERGDILELLKNSGWTVIDGDINSRSIRFKRPGATSGSSALFDNERRVFTCFSTSTSLSVDKGYSPSSLLTELEYDGDSKATYAFLVETDFGIKR